MIASKYSLSKEYVVERFNNSLDLLNAIEGKRLKRYDSSESYGVSNFTDNMSYDMAKKALVHGLERGMAKFNRTVKARTSLASKTSFECGNIGFAPIVPRAIMGLPNDMIVDVRRPVKGKVIDLYIDTRVGGQIEAEEYEACGNMILQAIVDLELQGYRCRVHAVKLAIMGRRVDIFTLPLKTEFQPIDIKRFTFPLLSVAFNRRIAWKWNETSPNVGIDDSGYSEHYSLEREGHKKDLATIFGKSAVFLKLEDGVRIKDLPSWIKERIAE